MTIEINRRDAVRVLAPSVPPPKRSSSIRPEKYVRSHRRLRAQDYTAPKDWALASSRPVFVLRLSQRRLPCGKWPNGSEIQVQNLARLFQS